MHFFCEQVCPAIKMLLALLILGPFINTSIILPLIFNFFLIPKIEKKIGKKLEYKHYIYQVALFGSFFGRYIEISYYMVVKFIASKLGFDPNKVNLGKLLALQSVNYNIEEASYVEVGISFFALGNILLVFLVPSFLWVLVKFGVFYLPDV